ncbi:hypothetical protein FO478_05185 [Heyndrickxia coagulans DSM 1 = ATCC 7050]|uniref:Uncharacterized protein n=1 Tax=Heyndrickxia coagulans TaxID=1398 RepID=A0A150K3V6_HEYCO|nr:hypothetical protein B4098_2795 [Heyndrickxia coagulans]MDR4223828.1 hypothetical protein [Heyndrickxia coagulans DSM 1 = ATCC 7050]QJE33069.1 hypothetical protein HHU11_11005 [Heyndrickxia coagulans]
MLPPFFRHKKNPLSSHIYEIKKGFITLFAVFLSETSGTVWKPVFPVQGYGKGAVKSTTKSRKSY